MTGSRTITANTAASILTLGGAITGSGILTKAGTGQLTLSGSNTALSGGVTLSAGTLNVNNASALGSSAGTFTINGGTLNNTSTSSITNAGNNPILIGASFTYTGTQALDLGSGAVTMTAATTPTLTVSGTGITFGGSLTESGFLTAITKAGGGVLTLGERPIISAAL